VQSGGDVAGGDAGESGDDDLPQGRLNAACYGYTGKMADADYDHLVSLQLGGDPSDARNLWVEPADPGHKPGSV
jgi:hypothetical protein